MRHLDDLTERLQNRRERLQYFIITASTAVLLFTVQGLGRDSFLTRSPLGVVAVAWGLLILASLGAILVLRQRHQLTWLYLRIRYRDSNPTAADQGVARRLRVAITVGEYSMGICFVAGIGLLTLSYLLVLLRG